MKSCWLLVALLSGIPSYAWQGTTPQAALEEIATATQPEVIARHLPEPVQKSIEVLPKPEKQRVLAQILEMKTSQLGGCTVRPAHDSDGWEILDGDGNSKGKVKVANAFISGVDALLPLEIELEDGAQAFIVTMHLEGGEWRIDHFGPWEKNDLGLGKLLHQPTEMEKNEAAARETLNSLRAALTHYASRFPHVGYPSDLRALTAPMVPENPFASNEALLDDSFAAEPLVKSGYLFRYLLVDVGKGNGNWGAFEITATPMEFGKTGSRNYLAYPSSVHATTENRPATEEDPSPND